MRRCRALAGGGRAFGGLSGHGLDRRGPGGGTRGGRDLSLDGCDVAERANALRLGFGRRLHIGCNEPLSLTAREIFQLRLRLPELLAKNRDAVVVARRLLLWTDDLGYVGLGLCPQGAGVRHQASDNKHGRPGRVSAFVGRVSALNIGCLHVAQCPPPRMRVSTIVFDSGIAKRGAAIFVSDAAWRSITDQRGRVALRRDGPVACFGGSRAAWHVV